MINCYFIFIEYVIPRPLIRLVIVQVDITLNVVDSCFLVDATLMPQFMLLLPCVATMATGT